MVQVGTRVRVIYPDYAAGMIGRIVGKEVLGRWIVKLEQHLLEENNETFLLSLEETDFEVLDRS
jgi:hypothetical protein